MEEKNKRVIVAVQDFGIGMTKENLDKIFSRFYRVEGLAPTFSGLGIGLYISHEIIERHHGKIWVESEPGKGSTFYFSIPCEQN
jgi:signal transduction histidine kinase